MTFLFHGETPTDKLEFYCLPFFSNSILTPIVAQTMRSMIGIDKPLFSLPINIAINSNTGITILHVEAQLLFEGAVLAGIDGSHDHILSAWRILLGAGNDILSRMLLYLLSADGRIGLTNARI